jgi:hypothetical protein
LRRPLPFTCPLTAFGEDKVIQVEFVEKPQAHVARLVFTVIVPELPLAGTFVITEGEAV